MSLVVLGNRPLEQSGVSNSFTKHLQNGWRPAQPGDNIQVTPEFLGEGCQRCRLLGTGAGEKLYLIQFLPAQTGASVVKKAAGRIINVT